MTRLTFWRETATKKELPDGESERIVIVPENRDGDGGSAAGTWGGLIGIGGTVAEMWGSEDCLAVHG